MKDGALGFIRRDPYAAVVSLDNRAANRQTHSHTFRFRREERVEYTVDVLRAEPRSRVRDRYHYATVLMDVGLHT
jgi:hypothetical protein